MPGIFAVHSSSRMCFPRGFAVAVLACASFGSALFPQSPGKSFVLPPGDYKVDQFAVSADETTILFTSSHTPDDEKRDVFLFDLRAGEVKKLLTGEAVGVWTVPIPRTYAVSTSAGLYLIKEDGTVGAPTVINNLRGVLRWTHDGNYFVFMTDRRKVDTNAPDYNEMGFTAMGILDMSTQKVRQFSVKTPAFRFHVIQSGDNIDKIYVSDDTAETEKQPTVNIYDVKGKHLDTRFDYYGINFSSAGQYYLPYIFEAGLPFRVRYADSGKTVVSFANEGDEEDENPVWNPQIENLLLLEHHEKQDGKPIVRFDVLNVARRSIVKSVPFGVAQWTPDGKVLVVFRDAKFVFEEIAP
jgi:hypothetical protein